MDPLLLIHNRFDYSTSDIWRAAIKRGWKTERIHDFNVKERIGDEKYVRYYGDTLQAANIKNDLPFEFIDIDPKILINNKFTNRTVNLLKYSELKQPIENDIFIKPVSEKWFEARVYKAGETIVGASNGDDLIYTSEIIDIVDEVRCFCLHGIVYTSSYYRQSKEVEIENFDDKISDTPLCNYVKQISEEYKIHGGIVLDFGLTKKNEWIFIEPNQAWASGIYWCDADECLSVIIKSQIDN
jgi:hypothetical protein